MRSKKPIRVLIADDSPTALQSVCEYLEFNGGFDVVGTASDGTNAVQLAEMHQPDLALVDLSMPRLNGLEVAKRLRGQMPALRMIIISELNGLSLGDECKRHGADSFVPKSEVPERLLPEIQRLFADRRR